MSFKKEWLKPRLRVITRDGPGELISYRKICEVKLDEPFAGKNIHLYEEGEIVIESDFTLVRIISGVFPTGPDLPDLVIGAQNYPSWEECLKAFEEPLSQNEELLALNFKEQKFKRNPPCLRNVELYYLIETYLGLYWLIKAKFYDSQEKAKEAWQRIDELSKRTDDIFLCTLIDEVNSRILTRAVFSTLKVITKEVWW
ncbi:MAG: hypothetical protein COV26_00635 [Candidatus Nealsonbacteria bacterium CG10_big_fil_rev_8_21_14_0_10_36_23]|uniref:Uncharacterized protein n=1 Tax=Candidatus Nealsonbacteria bacterium CG10_big_fil_rev_8_21_14_0_10_36_23 TaxID=1974709 RepID=A0A2H0TLL6_9BACT|nr:MAG: hypothetical protein COV26_00635 [Candidatus Nealsonbacteria bacterium CG10_big_fil_rev_8_21_14_0_10_36_23]